MKSEVLTGVNSKKNDDSKSFNNSDNFCSFGLSFFKYLNFHSRFRLCNTNYGSGVTFIFVMDDIFEGEPPKKRDQSFLPKIGRYNDRKSREIMWYFKKLNKLS